MLIGIEMRQKKLLGIGKRRNRFESINVLKDKKAVDKYGEKGKEGVVEVTMKKNK